MRYIYIIIFIIIIIVIVLILMVIESFCTGITTVFCSSSSRHELHSGQTETPGLKPTFPA